MERRLFLLPKLDGLLPVPTDVPAHFPQLVQVLGNLGEDVCRLNAFRGAIEPGLTVADEDSVAHGIEPDVARAAVDAGILAIVGKVGGGPEAIVFGHLLEGGAVDLHPAPGPELVVGYVLVGEDAEDARAGLGGFMVQQPRREDHFSDLDLYLFPRWFFHSGGYVNRCQFNSLISP